MSVLNNGLGNNQDEEMAVLVFNEWWNKSSSGSCAHFLIRLAVLNIDRQSVKTMNVMLQGETEEEEQSHMLFSIHHHVYLDILSSLLTWRNIQGKELKKKKQYRSPPRGETSQYARVSKYDISWYLQCVGDKRTV